MSDPRAGEPRAGFDGVFLTIRIALGFVPALVAIGFVGLAGLQVISKNNLENWFFGTLLFGGPVYLLVWSGLFLARLGAGPVLIVIGSILGGALMLAANVAIAFGGCVLILEGS